MKKLLWVGDACVATGFARATHYILDTLRHSFDVTVLGMNHLGDPDHGYPYLIYPTERGDVLGLRQIIPVCKKVNPDVIVFQNDVWNIPHYIKKLREESISTPVVAVLAVDGKNLQGQKLDGVSLAIFWTEFAQTEAREGGYDGPSVVIPLGIDLDIYKMEQLAHIDKLRTFARTRVQRTEDSTFDLEAFMNGFVVLNVNRNQQRKRLDLTVDIFAEWVHSRNITDAFLMVQACPTGEQEYDVAQLMDYYGLYDRLLLIYPDIRVGVPEKELVWTYRCADVGFTTTQGEGFGLTTFEMMACGIPMVVPNWAALGELCGDAAIRVPCSSIAATQRGVNVIGGVIDRDDAVKALDALYRSKDLRTELATRGLALVRDERYRWPNIGAAYVKAIQEHIFLSDDAEAAWQDLMVANAV